MDDSLILFAWTLGGTVAFGLLGALFGGLVGWLHWRHGASGTLLARKLADALAQLVEQELSQAQRAALVGAADGMLFLGMAGLLIGLIAGWQGQAPDAWRVPIFLVTLSLAGGALVFGFLALGIVHLRFRAVLGAFTGGIVAALLAAFEFGVVQIIPGAVLGMILGTLVAALLPGAGK
jgi:hypothetical protein